MHEYPYMIKQEAYGPHRLHEKNTFAHDKFDWKWLGGSGDDA